MRVCVCAADPVPALPFQFFRFGGRRGAVGEALVHLVQVSARPAGGRLPRVFRLRGGVAQMDDKAERAESCDAE